MSTRSTYREYADVIRTLDGDAIQAEMFEVIVGGSGSANTVFQAMTVAARTFDSNAAEFRGYATAMACDGEQVPFMTLRGVVSMAEQFERQAIDTRKVLALLRGDQDED